MILTPLLLFLSLFSGVCSIKTPIYAVHLFGASENSNTTDPSSCCVDSNVGFAFNTIRRIRILEVGIVDGQLAALNTSRTVRIWNLNSGEVAWEGVFGPESSGDTWESGFRYRPLDAPLVLRGSQDWAIAAGGFECESRRAGQCYGNYTGEVDASMPPWDYDAGLYVDFSEQLIGLTGACLGPAGPAAPTCYGTQRDALQFVAASFRFEQIGDYVTIERAGDVVPTFVNDSSLVVAGGTAGMTFGRGVVFHASLLVTELGFQNFAGSANCSAVEVSLWHTTGGLERILSVRFNRTDLSSLAPGGLAMQSVESTLVACGTWAVLTISYSQDCDAVDTSGTWRPDDIDGYLVYGAVTSALGFGVLPEAAVESDSQRGAARAAFGFYYERDYSVMPNSIEMTFKEFSPRGTPGIVDYSNFFVDPVTGQLFVSNGSHVFKYSSDYEFLSAFPAPDISGIPFVDVRGNIFYTTIYGNFRQLDPFGKLVTDAADTSCDPSLTPPWQTVYVDLERHVYVPYTCGRNTSGAIGVFTIDGAFQHAYGDRVELPADREPLLPLGQFSLHEPLSVWVDEQLGFMYVVSNSRYLRMELATGVWSLFRTSALAVSITGDKYGHVFGGYAYVNSGFVILNQCGELLRDLGTGTAAPLSVRGNNVFTLNNPFTQVIMSCKADTFGPTCESPCLPCHKLGGSCSSGFAGNGHCICQPGWMGDDCSISHIGYMDNFTRIASTQFTMFADFDSRDNLYLMGLPFDQSSVPVLERYDAASGQRTMREWFVPPLFGVDYIWGMVVDPRTWSTGGPVYFASGSYLYRIFTDSAVSNSSIEIVPDTTPVSMSMDSKGMLFVLECCASPATCCSLLSMCANGTRHAVWSSDDATVFLIAIDKDDDSIYATDGVEVFVLDHETADWAPVFELETRWHHEVHFFTARGGRFLFANQVLGIVFQTDAHGTITFTWGATTNPAEASFTWLQMAVASSRQHIAVAQYDTYSTMLMPPYKGCRENYYGATCEPCNCAGHGCVDGMDGDGTCLCGGGQFADGGNCTLCAAGYFPSAARLEGISECSPCEAGQYGPDGFVCLSCAPGTYAAQRGQGFCTPCDIGEYQPAPGSISCEKSPPGYFVDAENSTRYKSCPAGQYSQASGSGICKLCNFDQYNPVENATLCLPCPLHSSSRNASGSRCVCDAGYYPVDEHALVPECVSCPEGAGCDGARLPVAVEGFYPSRLQVDMFYPCLNPHSCLGNGVCADGYSGVLCGVCAPGMYLMDEHCVPCAPRTEVFGVGTVIMVVVLVLFIMFFTSHLQNRARDRAKLAIKIVSIGIVDEKQVFFHFVAASRRNSIAPAPDGAEFPPKPPALPAPRPASAMPELATGADFARAFERLGSQSSTSSASRPVPAVTTFEDAQEMRKFQEAMGLTGTTMGDLEAAIKDCDELNVFERCLPPAVRVVVTQTRTVIDGSVTRIIIGFVQVVSQFTSTYKISWPNPYYSFLVFFKTLNLSFIGASSGSCLFGITEGSFFLGYAMFLFGPLLMIALLYAVLRTIAHVLRTKFHKFYVTNGVAFDVWVMWSIMLMFVVYTSVSARMLEYWQCITFDDVQYLQSDYSVPCWTDTHLRFLPLAVLGTLLYPVGLPALWAFVLYRNRRRIREDVILCAVKREQKRRMWLSDQELEELPRLSYTVKGAHLMVDDRCTLLEGSECAKPIAILERARVQLRYGVLFNDFESSMIYWGCFDAVRRLVLTSLLVFVQQGTGLQLAVAVIVSVIAMLLHAYYHAYKSRKASVFQMCCLVVITLTLFCGMLVKSSQEDGGAYNTSGEAIGAFLVSVNIAVVLLGIGLLLWRFGTLVRKSKLKLQRMASSRIWPPTKTALAMAASIRQRRPSIMPLNVNSIYVPDDDDQQELPTVRDSSNDIELQRPAPNLRYGNAVQLPAISVSESYDSHGSVGSIMLRRSASTQVTLKDVSFDDSRSAPPA